MKTIASPVRRLCWPWCWPEPVWSASCRSRKRPPRECSLPSHWPVEDGCSPDCRPNRRWTARPDCRRRLSRTCRSPSTWPSSPGRWPAGAEWTCTACPRSRWRCRSSVWRLAKIHWRLLPWASHWRSAIANHYKPAPESRTCMIGAARNSVASSPRSAPRPWLDLRCARRTVCRIFGCSADRRPATVRLHILRLCRKGWEREQVSLWLIECFKWKFWEKKSGLRLRKIRNSIFFRLRFVTIKLLDFD